MSIYQVFFELEYDLDQKIEIGDLGWIQNVFSFCEWCFKQRSRNPGIWNAAATAFLEHLADEDERAELITHWVSQKSLNGYGANSRNGEGEKARGKRKSCLIGIIS